MSGESSCSLVRQRPQLLGPKQSIISSDSSPLPRRRNSNSGGAAAVVADSADVSSKPKPAEGSCDSSPVIRRRMLGQKHPIGRSGGHSSDSSPLLS